MCVVCYIPMRIVDELKLKFLDSSQCFVKIAASVHVYNTMTQELLIKTSMTLTIKLIFDFKNTHSHTLHNI